MDLKYIDHEELQVTPEFIQQRVDILSDEGCTAWDDLVSWWIDHNMPQGLELIQIHLQSNLREWIIQLFEERDNNDAPTDTEIVDAALVIDSMID